MYIHEGGSNAALVFLFKHNSIRSLDLFLHLLLYFSDPSLMCHRKFPASFWNSNYYGPGSFYSDFQFPSGHYSTSSIPGFSGFQDPWFSRFSSQSHTFHHRPMHYDFPYSSMSASRYNSNIGSLLLQSARSGHFPGSDYGKSTDTKFRYPDYRLGTEYPTQNSFPGLYSTF